MDNTEFIVLLQIHPNLGLLAYPYFIEPVDEGFKIIEKISLLKAGNYQLSESELKLVKIAENYTDQHILKLFSKKKLTVKEFFKKLDPEYAGKYIKPYLEKNLSKLFALLSLSKIRCFKRTKKESNLYGTDEIKTFENPAEVIFNFHKTDTEIHYHISISQNGKEIQLNEKNGKLLSNEPCWLLMDNKLFSFKEIDGKKLLPFFNKTHISIDKKFEKKYFEGFILNSIKKFKVNYSGFDIIQLKPVKETILTVEKDLKGDPVFIPKFSYNEKTYRPDDINLVYTKLEIENGNYCYYQIFRDKKWEKEQTEKIKELGLILNENGHFIVPVSKNNDKDNRLAITINWLNENEWKLKNDGFIIKQDFYKKNYFTEKISLDLQIGQKKDWFDIYGYAVFGDIRIPFIKLKNHILNGKREFILPNGEIAILPAEWFSRYTNLFKFGKTDIMGIKLDKFHCHLLDDENITDNSGFLSRYKELLNTGFAKDISIPEQFQSELRPYQKKGYSWLHHIKTLGFGACLADDMGLGKTIQTLALLLKVKSENINTIHETGNDGFKKSVHQLSLFDNSIHKTNEIVEQSSPSLIVVPVSLIHNWQKETIKFAPSLKIYLYINHNRTKETDTFNDYDIIITTYGIVRNDIEILENIDFHYIILDESQIIKNPLSKIYKAVLRLQSQHKLVLTGTPIENSLTDLWAQMNFLNYGLLGDLRFFKEEFQKPIENQNSEEHQIKLNKLISPFLLRRTKDEVVKDLPPVTEQTQYCTMTTEQKSYYEEEKSKIRNIILENINKKGLKHIAIEVLQALNKLRQLSIHPSLINKNYKHDSGKFNQIIRNIESVISENHKILVFSSYVKHLNLLASYFDDNDIRYSILTGKVKQNDREKTIAEFKDNSDNHVFLISIKAGGVGLNLTEADYVFIVDPWWNPAAEWQAISRAHRIGQDKKVFVYRYISVNSIEEKIVRLQERKTKLADLFINTNSPYKSLSKEEVEELFA